MTRRIWIGAAMALLLSFAIPAGAAGNDWLLGDWRMTYDPDGDPSDEITFAHDGGFTTRSVKTGRQYSGTYFVRPGIIKVNIINQGRYLMKFELTYDEKKDRLYYTSQKTGNTSHYTRIRN